MEWFIVIKIVQNILNDQNQIRQRHKEQRERESVIRLLTDSFSVTVTLTY